MMVSTDPMHQFKIGKLFDLKIGGLDISFTTSALWMVIGVLLVIGLLAIATSKTTTIPSRLQSLAEIWYSFIAGIVKDVNHAPGKPFVPLVFSLFSFIFIANLIGMFPYFLTTTSHIVVTGFMALFTILLVVVLGVFKKGFGFLKNRHLINPSLNMKS